MLGVSHGQQLPMGNVATDRASSLCRFLPGKQTGYAVGGSGTLFKTEDNGVTWKRDRCAISHQPEKSQIAGPACYYFCKLVSQAVWNAACASPG